MIFDANDGAKDGQATIFDKGYDVCKHMPVADVVNYLAD
jgi:hypothetical protein